MTDTRDSLYATILESPDDDAPRLIYADWCDENDVEGHGEFIRVQVELANLIRSGPKQWLDDIDKAIDANDHAQIEWRSKVFPLRQRERDLWSFKIFKDRSGIERFSPDFWFAYDKNGGWNIAFGMNRCFVNFDLQNEPDIRIDVERGFPSILACTLNQWLEYGKEIVRRFPIARVKVMDKEPQQISESCWRWGSGEGSSVVLVSHEIYSYLSNQGYYDTKDHAEEDLSQACLRWARA